MSLSNYTVLEPLGEGSFGKVYVVVHKSSGKQYVMKEIALAQANTREQALKEVEFLKEFRHPNIISYVEYFEQKTAALVRGGKPSSTLYIVMQYADGGDLAARIAAQRRKSKGKIQPFSESLILDWFVQICLAMKHVHDRRILHRDIKSQNIFLTQHDTIKVGDFGKACGCG